MIEVICPACKKTMKAPFELAGKTVQCLACKAPLTVPGLFAGEPAAPAPRPVVEATAAIGAVRPRGQVGPGTARTTAKGKAESALLMKAWLVRGIVAVAVICAVAIGVRWLGGDEPEAPAHHKADPSERNVEPSATSEHETASPHVATPAVAKAPAGYVPPPMPTVTDDSPDLTVTEQSVATMGEPVRVSKPLMQSCASGVVLITTAGGIGTRGTAAGFVFGDKSTILTTYHLITGAVTFTVTVSAGPATVFMPERGLTQPCDVLAVDPLSDLALLRTASPLPVSPLEFAEASDLADGAQVFSIAHTTAGIAFNSQMLGGKVLYLQTKRDGLSFVQTSTPFVPTSDGAALFALNGKVLGMITSRGRSTSTEGLAISAAVLHQFHQQREGKFRVTGAFYTWEKERLQHPDAKPLVGGNNLSPAVVPSGAIPGRTSAP